MDTDYLSLFGLSLLLGGFMGLEREYHKDEIVKGKIPVSSLGVRTFSLISLLGTVTGVLLGQQLLISLILCAGVLLLILANYIVGSLYTKDSGITTELAGMFAFVVGILLTLPVIPLQMTVALSVVVTLIMSRKQAIKEAVAKLHGFETNAFITYALIALVILPFLPNRSITVNDIGFFTTLLTAYGISLGKLGTIELINPYKLWFIVALITGIDMLGYFLNKYMGQGRGYILSALTGGFVSSTGTTIALAQESKRSMATGKLVGAALLANTASFFQMIFLLAPISQSLLVASTLPVLGLILAGFTTALCFLLSRNLDGKTKLQFQKKAQTQVFSLHSALTFAGLYVLVRFGSNVALAVLGNSGVYVTSALGALVGIDAVTINTADLVSRNAIDIKTAIIALLIANAVNLFAKTFYAYTQGSIAFTVRFGMSVLVIIVASVLGFIAG
jgi:uncharacterized membrane protein (DUF4010 family)